MLQVVSVAVRSGHSSAENNWTATSWGCRRSRCLTFHVKPDRPKQSRPLVTLASRGCSVPPQESAAALVEGRSGPASAPYRATTLAEFHRPCVPLR